MSARDFLALALLALAPAARADTVYFKSGGQMEGLVIDENRRQVELEVGGGTVTLQRKDILRIVHSSGRQRAKLKERYKMLGFDVGEGVPAAAKPLDQAFRSLHALRKDALDAKARREELFSAQAVLQTEISSQRRSYEPMAQRLNSLSPGDSGYNSAVRDLNLLVTGMRSNELKLAESRSKSGEGQAEIHQYLTAYEDFKRRVAEDDKASGRGATSPEEKNYYDWLKRAVARMDGDFAQESVASSRRGSGVLVSVLLNGKVSASLLVDTGASLVGLKRDVVERLGLDTAAMSDVEMVVADGRKVKEKAFLLDSLAVGKMRAEKVEAATLSDFPECDGLLGMSFLKHFDVRVDAEGGRFILKELKRP